MSCLPFDLQKKISLFPLLKCLKEKMKSLPRICDFNIVLRLETLPLNRFRCVQKQEI